MTVTTPTAALLIIGNEILSGRTQDANIKFIAERLSLRGVGLMEIRVVRDDETAIVTAVQALSAAYDMVFTTGGIGPTHDDITADGVAKAFGATVGVDPAARQLLETYYAGRDMTVNESRLRMARIPAGATLIENPVSAAPGFTLGNVHVLAGVPKIMQAMFTWLEPKLPRGVPLMANTVSCSLREGDIAVEMEAIQKRFPTVEIGSYPVIVGEDFSLSLVLRGIDEGALEQATDALAHLIKTLNDAPIITRQRPPVS